MGKKKLPDLQITELYLVKADWHRTFMAQIVRDKTTDGEDIIRGSVVVNEGKIWCVSESGSEEELGMFLDDICSLKLDYGLHEKPGITIKIAGVDFFLN
jgi:hypothetical protein